MKIGYIETFPVVGLERWRKIPLEVEVKEEIDFLNATDEEIDAFMLKVRRIQYKLKEQVQSFFFESKGHDEKLAAESKADKKIEQNIPFDEAMLIADIYACDVIDDKKGGGLRSYSIIAKKTDALTKAFDSQFYKLTAKK